MSWLAKAVHLLGVNYKAMPVVRVRWWSRGTTRRYKAPVASAGMLMWIVGAGFVGRESQCASPSHLVN